ncbi:hypothetical protein KHA80_10775 [Anaerobacillus sp. HL2]|nr:hypothetical protein KHA80_10775 [Anaerobacillus sp. HL2]
MIEHIKTTILWILILLSVFLTYQIWTFQPNYGILENTGVLTIHKLVKRNSYLKLSNLNR